jgi:hypothetical protein
MAAWEHETGCIGANNRHIRQIAVGRWKLECQSLRDVANRQPKLCRAQIEKPCVWGMFKARNDHARLAEAIQSEAPRLFGIIA